MHTCPLYLPFTSCRAVPWYVMGTLIAHLWFDFADFSQGRIYSARAVARYTLFMRVLIVFTGSVFLEHTRVYAID